MQSFHSSSVMIVPNGGVEGGTTSDVRNGDQEDAIRMIRTALMHCSPTHHHFAEPRARMCTHLPLNGHHAAAAAHTAACTWTRVQALHHTVDRALLRVFSFLRLTRGSTETAET